MPVLNFAVFGVGGYVAPRHLKAILETGNRVVAAADPHDSVGVLDRFGFDIRYFRETERLDRFLDKLRRAPEEHRVHVVSVCSPNYLHDAHIRIALRNGADVICEKPLVINPWNLDALERLEEETGRRVSTVLQLRVHPDLQALRQALLAESASRRHQVELTYVTGRGPWYDVSWKGSEEQSGGVALNIGVHFFDLLIWLFGPVSTSRIHHRDRRCCAGRLELARADVSWFLSVDRTDIPRSAAAPAQGTFRSISIDGRAIEFSDGFNDLHTKIYELSLRGEGFGIADARPSIDLVHTIRQAPVTNEIAGIHPLLATRRSAT